MSWIHRKIAALRGARRPGGVSAFPTFRYHPDPLETGAVQSTELACKSCGMARGFRVAHHYGVESFDCICPWCVANGKAARTLGVSFVQDAEGEIPPDVWQELSDRTPGYESWQGENWLTHCNDACAFLGDLPRDEVTCLPLETERTFLAENEWLDDWPNLKTAYASGDCSTSLYKFACLHCSVVRLGVDFS